LQYGRAGERRGAADPEEQHVPAIDIDPEILRITAAASAHAYAQSIWHIQEEINASSGDMVPLYATLTEEGPYAYMVLPELQADGTVKLPRITTREEIVEAYEMIRGMSDLLEVTGLTEIRGSWYTFQDNISRACMKGDEANVHTVQTLGMFPSGAGPGITGELVWIRYPVDALGSPDEPNTIPDDPLLARARVYDNFLAFQAGLRANDVDAVMSVLHDGIASTVRDYVEDTGTITDHKGAAVHRAYYEALLAKYDIQAVDMINQVIDDWYVFAELRITAIRRDGGERVAFHTAEFWMPAKTGKFIARVGHGTEPAAQ
jgi:hypothetical protein